jgi:hypothetical protein
VKLAEAREVDFATGHERVGDRVEDGVHSVCRGLLAADSIVCGNLV